MVEINEWNSNVHHQKSHNSETEQYNMEGEKYISVRFFKFIDV